MEEVTEICLHLNGHYSSSFLQPVLTYRNHYVLSLFLVIIIIVVGYHVSLVL